MKMKMRKLISMVSAAILFATPIVPVTAAQSDKGDKVSLIIEVEGTPLLQTKNAIALGASEFMTTEESKREEVRLLSTQEVVKSSIKKRVRTVDTGFSYTSVFNGFSMDAYEADIQAIKNVEGVKNVYISNSYPIEPVITEDEEVSEPEAGAGMMNVEWMYDHGYDGRGQAVAVIDSEFDLGHEFFSSDIINPKYSKDDIKTFLEENLLNIDVSVNQIYRNEKIPFAYDYAEKDADTYATASVHGTHVAGIISGKNGHYGDSCFSGMAPESQLFLMKVGTDEGLLKDESVIAAFDDAAKLGITAINFSVGSIRAEEPIFEDILASLRNAGIIVMCSAGNFDRAQNVEADKPDYAYPSSPAMFSDATSVASINANAIWITKQTITLGNADMVIYEVEDETGFFEKFSDAPYEYILADTVEQTEGVDCQDKVLICNSDILLNLDRTILREAAGIIMLVDDSMDSKGLVLPGEIPMIIMRSSVRDQFYNSDIKTLQTSPDKEYVQRADKAIMSYFSSWGTTTRLELKPEITAPGGTILSSVVDDRYENKSGTSMAAPHMTGAAALMNGFLEEKYPLLTGADKVSLMENLLMSSADIIYQDEEKTLPESPRRQGAGLANLERATKIPVILKGNTGKSKLSLGDQLTNTIDLTFTVQNITDNTVTYDDIDLLVFTDNSENRDGVDYITDSVLMNFTSNADTISCTIPAHSEEEITITLYLDEAQTQENLKVFTNGFFVDGFVVLNSTTDDIPNVNMPFTGYYGDWTSFEALEPTYFESESNGIGGLVTPGNESYETAFQLGENQILNELVLEGSIEDYQISEYEKEEYSGYSPNGDNLFDMLGIELYSNRSLVNTSIYAYDSNGNVVWEGENPAGICRTTDGITTLEGPSMLPDGDYVLHFEGKLGYDRADCIEKKEFSFYVDTVPPQISEPRIYEDNDRVYAAFSAKDNRYLMGAKVFDGDIAVAAKPIKALKDTEIVFDVTDVDLQNLHFKVMDYAYNTTDFKIGDVSAEVLLGPVINGNSMSFSIRVTNTDTDIDANIIAAIYSEDGRMLNAKIQQQKIVSGQTIVKSFDFQNLPDDYKNVKVFVWTRDTMTPLTETLTIK